MSTKIYNEKVKFNEAENLATPEQILTLNSDNTLSETSLGDFRAHAGIAKPITVTGAGQSNMVGQYSGGDMTSDSRVFVWRKDLTIKAWVVADLQEEPFNGNNNILFQFAKKYAETYDVEVKIILNAEDGVGIQEWTKTDGSENLWNDLVDQVTDSGTTDIDIFLWHQGEALPDRNNTLAWYADQFNQLQIRLKNQNWYGENTPFIAGELLNVHPQMNEFYKNIRFKDWVIDKNVSVARANDLQGEAGDPIHFSSEELVTLGRERYWDAWRSTSEQYSSGNNTVFIRNGNQMSIGVNSDVYNNQSLSPDVYINGGNVPLMMENEGLSQFLVMANYRDSAFGPVIQGRAARGTILLPEAILTSKNLISIAPFGYNGTAFTSGSSIILNASEDWSPTTTGSNIEMYTIENGTVASVLSLVVQDDGVIEAPATTNDKIEAATDKVLISKEYANDKYAVPNLDNEFTSQTIQGSLTVNELLNNTTSLQAVVSETTFGTESVIDGDFATDDPAWIKGAGTTISGGVSNFDNTSTNLQQTGIVGAGVSGIYYITWEQVVLTGTRFRAFFRNGADTGSASITILDTNLVSTNATSSGDFYALVSITDGLTINFLSEAGNTGTIDNVSTKKVTNKLQQRTLGANAFSNGIINTSTPQTSATLNASFPDAEYPIGVTVLNQDSTERYIYTKITSTTWRRSDILTNI